MDVFAHDGDIYKMTASQMFRIPIDQIDKPLRQRGKVSVLALGYQGGTGALIAMGALKMGVPEEDLPKLVKAWRKANPHIVRSAQRGASPTGQQSSYIMASASNTTKVICSFSCLPAVNLPTLIRMSLQTGK